MFNIELIGPSGVGKSSIFNKIKKTPFSKRNFYTLHEAEIATSLKNSKLFYKLYLKNNLIDKGKLYLARKVNFNDSNFNYSLEDKRFLGSILFNSFQTKSKFAVSFNTSKYILKLIEIYSSIDLNSMVLIDEGLWHKIPANLISLTPSTSVLMPNAAIHCTDNYDNIFNKIKLRKDNGVTAIGHKGLSDNELLDEVKESINDCIKIEEFFISKGVPVLRIDTSNDIKSNCETIVKFINKQSRQASSISSTQ